MQTTKRHHAVPSRTAKIKKASSTKGLWECGATELTYWPRALGSKVWWLLKLNIQYDAAILRLFTQRHENTCPQQDLCKYVHSSSIHNRHKLESTQTATGRQTKRVAEPHNGDYSRSEEQTTNACSDTYAPQSHCAESNKSDTKDYIPYRSIYIKW